MAKKKVARKKKVAKKKVAKKKISSPEQLPWPPPEVVQRYSSLTPEAQSVAILLASWGSELVQRELYQLVMENDLHAAEGKLMTMARMRAAVQELKAADWIEEGFQSRFQLEMLLVNPVLELAARNGRLRSISGSILSGRSSLFSHASHRYDFPPAMLVICRARVAFFLSDWKMMRSIDTQENRDYDDRPLFNLYQFLSPSPYSILFSRLPREDFPNALVQVCHNIARVQTPVGDLLPEAHSLALGYPLQTRFYPEILFFRGDIAGLESLRDEIRERERAPEIDIELHQIDGSICYLRAEDDQAIEHFEQALGLIKSLSGRRKKIFLRGYCGIPFIIALLRRRDPESLSAARKFAAIGGKLQESQWSIVLNDLSAALESVYGDAEGFHDETVWQDAPPADLLSIAWREIWTGQVELPDMLRFDRLMFDAELADENGYRWLAAELYLLASKFAGPTHGDQPAEKAAKLFEEISPKLQPAVEVVKKLEPWESLLHGIEFIATAAKPAKKKSATGEDAPEGRLAWVIIFNPDMPARWKLFPVEQKVGKSGSWNKPRNIALKRLAENPPAFASDQDRRAMVHISRDNSWSGQSSIYLKQEKAIMELVGHPLLFMDAALKLPIELARREVELILQPSGKGEIYLRLDPPMIPGEQVTLTRDSPTRLFVTETTKSAKKLQELFGAEGVTLPENAKERVIKAATALAGEINVQSQIGGSGIGQADMVEADGLPQLHLVPLGNGLSAEILMQPIPDAGSHYQPGDGSELVFARDEDGQSLQARRDLAAEVSGAQLAIDSLPSLAEPQDDPYRWALPEPIACLELLTEIHRMESGLLSVHWPKGESFKLKGEADTPQVRMSLKKKRGWFQASGELEIDDGLVLTMQQLIDLTENSETGRFIQLDDGRFIALTEEFRRRLGELGAYSSPSPDAEGELQINELAAYAIEEMAEQVQLDADKDWRDHIQRLEHAESYSAEVPGSLRAELRPYQLDGFLWLAKLAEWGVGGCLADDMGLGKTVQALALLLHRSRGGPALVIAPTSVATNWIRESARFAPTLNVRQFGPGDRADSVKDLGAADLIICTFGLMQIENELLAEVDWHTVVIDEAQAIKNAMTKRAKAAMNLKADFRLITTGTPIENNLGELHTLFQFINPGLLGSAEKFRRRFADPIQKTGNPQSRRWLKKLISPFILRRLKHEVLDDLPPRTEIVLEVEMSEEETAFYEALRVRAVENLASEQAQSSRGGQQGIRILAEITRLRRACCNPKLVAKEGPAPESSKLRVFAETLSDLLEGNHKVLVFSQFVDHLSILREHLDKEKISYKYLDGSTPAKKRQIAIDAFQSGDGDAFLISLKAGGTGLNLTAADYVIHMDPWWNPASEDQASDRAHRIGQLRPVTVYRLVTKGTIEEKIVALHHEKRDLASSLLEGTDTGRMLNPEELLALIKG